MRVRLSIEDGGYIRGRGGIVKGLCLPPTTAPQLAARPSSI